MSEEKKKLTLKRTITGTVESSRGGTIAVEVRKKRTFGSSSTSSVQEEETSTIADDKAAKLKELLENAKEVEAQEKIQAEKNAQISEERTRLIEAQKQEEEKLRKKLEEQQKQVEIEKQNINPDPAKADSARTKKFADNAKKTTEEEIEKRKKHSSSKDTNNKSHKLSLSKAAMQSYHMNDVESDDRLAGGNRRYKAHKKSKEKLSNFEKPTEKIIREVLLPETITVKEFAEKMAEKGAAVVKELMKLGVMATINQVIDADTAELVANELGHKVKRVTESDLEDSILLKDDDNKNQKARPPVVTIMGHVDHGKTSLLDALRQTDVASGEAGGITQHIGAYQIQMANEKKITFIDTPGHAAFSAMRARGANVTDIVVLVVAANDSIMPQTIEAINHSKAAGVPIVVAINKIDLPQANPNKVRTDLLSHEVVVESMGGDVLEVEVSAKNKINLDKLEEAILLQAEMLNLTANPDRIAEGVVIESEMKKGLGSTATVLIQKGTLKKGDIFVSGMTSGRVREMFDHLGNKVKESLPAMPIAVLGFSGVPVAGDDFVIVANEAKAREVAEYRLRKEKEKSMIVKSKSAIEEMLSGIAEGEKITLPVIIKCDVQGSSEAIIGMLDKIGNEKAKVNVIHSAVGGINETDITLAASSKAMIIAFNVRANAQARDMAKHDGIDIRYHSIIYDVANDVKSVLEGQLEPEYKENFIGYADILQTFKIGKTIVVAGCRVSEGVIKRGCKCRVIRDDVVVYEGDLGQLKHQKDDLKEAKKGTECGMSFEKYNDLKVGDKIECFEMEAIAVKLD